MKEIEISVTSDYVSWGVQEGIREIIQNAIDADVKGYLAEIDYDKEKKSLMVRNRGARIPLESLLIGYSSKRGDTETVGQYGEGFKLGCMALINKGLSVRIVNGADVWRPVIKRSQTFEGMDVLFFQIEKNANQDCQDHVTFYIDGLDDLLWHQIRPNFLLFTPRQKYQVYENPFGSVLHSDQTDEFKGCVYVNGILVEKISDEDFAFGYNLNPAHVEVDRDRNMIRRYNLKSTLGQLWNYLGEKPEYIGFVESMLEENKADVSAYEHSWNTSSKIKELIAERFIKKHGKTSVPVTSDLEAKEMSYVNRDPVITNKVHSAIVQSRIGNLMDFKHNFASDIKKNFGVNDLKDEESIVLFKAWNTLVSVVGVTLPEVKVCDFSADSTLGLHVRADGTETIYIARKVLSTGLYATLRVLIHEYAHSYGDHFCKEFLDKVETTWMKVCDKLYGSSIT